MTRWAFLGAGAMAGAMVRGLLAAGTTKTDAITCIGGNDPAGWVAVRYSGPVFGYALNTAVGKDFALKPGAMIRAEPTNESQVFSIVGEGDTAEVVELAGDWSRVVFDKSTILFLHLGEAAPTPVAPEETSASQATAVTLAAAAASPPPPPVPTIEATPRVFQGYLTRTRRIFGAGPKLDYQLLDERNKRIALLDLSALLLTDPIDRLEDRQVSVFGLPTSREGIKDLVIRVETIRLIN